MTGNVVAIRPEVITPEVLPRRPATDADLLDGLMADVRHAVDRLSESECGPAAGEVGRWLRARVGDTQAALLRSVNQRAHTYRS